MRRQLPRIASVVGVGVVASLAIAAPVFAATSITAPSGSPYVVSADASGKPKPFTVSVAGFQPNISVYIEQCSGKSPADPKWKPTLDCDVLSSPAAAITNEQGVATFDAADTNHAFHPFTGESPEQLFNCVGEGDKAPDNNLPDYDDCQVRVASTNQVATTDQVFLTMKLPGSGGAASSSSSDSSDPPYVVIAAVVVVVVAGGAFFLVYQRRRGAP